MRVENRKVSVVARDGLEPPTPAFSGLRSVALNLLIRLRFALNFALKNTIILEWYWNGNGMNYCTNPSTTFLCDSGMNCW